MTCEALTIGGARVIVCSSRGRRRARKDCCVCRTRPASLECDGPPRGKKADCSRPLCERCAIRVLARGLDFCPEHAQLVPVAGGCQASPTQGLPCRGPLVGPAESALCLVHLVLFDHWLVIEGGRARWKALADAQARRQLFRDWVESAGSGRLATILRSRRVPEAPPPGNPP